MQRHRVVALFLLCLIAGFAVGAAHDACDDGACGIDCHFACVTGCLHAVLGGAAVVPPRNEAVRRDAVPADLVPPSHSSEPEPEPPRA